MKPFSLEEYLKNPSRKIVTMDGRNVRIISTNAKGKCPIVALVENFSGNEMPISYTKDGEYRVGDKSGGDLFFATEKHEGWINIFNGVFCDIHASCGIYKSKEAAEKVGNSLSGYIASVKIEWEE